MQAAPPKVVYDCNVYLQHLLSPAGPASRCVRLAFDGAASLFVSDPVVAELRALPGKPVARRFGLDVDRVERFVSDLLRRATHLADVPSLYVHPIDPDDSAYVDLALAADARLIVSRDRHLLGLSDPSKPWADDFRRRFPSLRVVTVEGFLATVVHD